MQHICDKNAQQMTELLFSTLLPPVIYLMEQEQFLDCLLC